MIHSNRVLARYKKNLTAVNPLGILNNGKWVELSLTQTFPIRAHVQPIRDKEVKFLPEGATRDDYRNVITGKKLQVQDDKEQTTGTRILQFLGFDWTVISKHEHGVGNRHNGYIMQKRRSPQ